MPQEFVPAALAAALETVVRVAQPLGRMGAAVPVCWMQFDIDEGSTEAQRALLEADEFLRDRAGVGGEVDTTGGRLMISVWLEEDEGGDDEDAIPGEG